MHHLTICFSILFKARTNVQRILPVLLIILNFVICSHALHHFVEPVEVQRHFVIKEQDSNFKGLLVVSDESILKSHSNIISELNQKQFTTEVSSDFDFDSFSFLTKKYETIVLLLNFDNDISGSAKMLKSLLPRIEQTSQSVFIVASPSKSKRLKTELTHLASTHSESRVDENVALQLPWMKKSFHVHFKNAGAFEIDSNSFNVLKDSQNQSIMAYANWRSGSRFGFINSLTMFENSVIQNSDSNLQLFTEMVNWVSQKRAYVHWANPYYHKIGEEAIHEEYICGDEIEFTIDLWDVSNMLQNTIPISLVLLDDVYPLQLTKKSSTKYALKTKLPLLAGTYKFQIRLQPTEAHNVLELDIQIRLRDKISQLAKIEKCHTLYFLVCLTNFASLVYFLYQNYNGLNNKSKTV